MNFIQKRTLKEVCYELKATETSFFIIDKNSFYVTDLDGNILKKYSVSNPAYFCVCNENTVALLDTSGQFYIIESDSLKMIPVKNKSEGTSPVSFENCVYWADWNGRILRYNLIDKTLDIFADFGDENLMPRCVDVDRNNRKLLVTALNRKNEIHYLLHSDLNEADFQRIELPLKKRSTNSGVIWENGRLYCCDSKSSLVYAFELSENELTVVKTVKIPKKYADGLTNISVFNEKLGVQNSNCAAVIDMNSGKIIFEFSEKYLSSIYLNNDILCIGSWNNGYLFDIV